MLKIYPNDLKSGEFDEEAPKLICPERVTIAERQGTSEDENAEAKPTKSKTNLSSRLGIYPSEPPETLEQMLIDAGEDDAAPPEPPGGIPKQFLPSWIRWPIRVLFLPLVLLDLWTQRLARFFIRPPLKQTGTCKKRGYCCRYILIPISKGLFSRLYYLWNIEVLGFYRRDDRIYESEGRKVYVMGCRYLSKKGICTRYALRPAVCRKWPIIEYFGYPRILKGCGFKAVYRDQPDKEVL